jgi:methylmalonyl-CoA/ethylmalonyl-CoA epimerase
VNVRKIEHLGIACRSAEQAAAFYSGVLGLPEVSRETLADLKLKVIKVRAGESVLELLEPLEGEAVISKFLASRGEGIHHVCFEVDDVREAARELRAKGYQALWEEPKPGAGGRLVNFLRPKETFGVLVELNQEKEGSAS